MFYTCPLTQIKKQAIKTALRNGRLKLRALAAAVEEGRLPVLTSCRCLNSGTAPSEVQRGPVSPGEVVQSR
jgi:hypothetical protein